MTCSLEITSDYPVIAGTNIVGSVLCNFSKPTKIKGILVNFYGYESTETVGYSRAYIRGHNVLVDIENVIIASEIEVPGGTSKHGFTIEVPFRLPSSFKHFNGEIKYSLKAFIKRHHRIDIIVSRDLDFVSYVDLNTYLPALQIQAEYSADRLVSHCCGLSRGRILLTAVIGKRLFLKGETITLDLNIVNLSGVRVKKVYSRIMKTVTIFFTTPYPKEEIYRDFLAKSPNFPGVKGYNETSYPLYIQIPNDIFIPNFRHSKLFKITHQLQIIAKISGLNTAMILQFKIYVGHIPLSSTGLHLDHRSRKGPFIRDPNTDSASSVRTKSKIN